MTIVAIPFESGRALLAPPGFFDRAAVLRTAFEAMVKDETSVAEARRRNIDIEPMIGGELRSVVETSMRASAEAIQQTRKLLAQ